MTAPIRVLIAEDHTLVREGTRTILEMSEDIAVVAEAADGETAVDLARDVRPDVAIIDIGLPHLNGIEVTRQIKRTNPGIGVLALTVHEEDQYVLAAIEAGAAGYLLKDVAGEALVDAVRAVCAGESVLHPAIARRVFSRVAAGGNGNQADDHASLTAREMEVLELAAHGRTNREIAHELGLSTRTVQTHLRNVFRKLDVASRTEAVILALRRGWFPLDRQP